MNTEQKKPEVGEKVRVEPTVKHTNIYAALSNFQGELKPMAKTGKVKFEKKNGTGTVDYNYTPLGDIMETIYPLLKKHGLSVRHEITKEGVEAILTHETYKRNPIYVSDNSIARAGDQVVAKEPITKLDEGIENEIRSGVVKLTAGNEMKDTGAAITYARRYTLTMVLGISSEDDKDAELLEQSSKNAIQTVYSRFKAGLEKATTVAEIEKSMGVLRKDVENLAKNKAPALGLAKEQYDELIKLGDSRIDDINSNQDTEGK